LQAGRARRRQRTAKLPDQAAALPQHAFNCMKTNLKNDRSRPGHCRNVAQRLLGRENELRLRDRNNPFRDSLARTPT